MAHDTSSDAAEGAPLARTPTVDAVVAALLAALGGLVIFEAQRLGAGWTSDGPGAGYFPFYIGVILVICGIGVLLQALRARSSEGSDGEVFVDSVQLKRVLSVLLPSAVYVGAIMLLGIYVASALFIALFMVILGKYPVLRSVVVGLGVNALFFMMFEVWFKVPLYKGEWHPLSFLGY
jgi:hypothetical protein